MKLLFFLAIWKRPEITEICFMGLARLKKTGLFPMEFFAVISEEPMIPLCKKYGVDYCFYKNEPLGEKKNYGLTQAFKKSWDYLIELGSDDLIKNEYLELFEPFDYLTVRNFAIINSENGDCRTFTTGTGYGLGRAISREVLDKHAKGVSFKSNTDIVSTDSIAAGDTGFLKVETANDMVRAGYGEIISEECYKIWSDNQNRGLDNHSMFFLAKNGVLGRQIKSETPIAIDIKSKENLWPFNPDFGQKESLDKVLVGLSEEEKTGILSLVK
jgi:hypothetical protein